MQEHSLTWFGPYHLRHPEVGMLGVKLTRNAMLLCAGEALFKVTYNQPLGGLWPHGDL
jgi:hypothetical protein